MKYIKIITILALSLFSKESYANYFTTIWESNGTVNNPDTLDFKMRTNGDTVFWYIWYLDNNDAKISNTADTLSFTRSTSPNIIYLTTIRHTGRVLLEIESKNLTQFSVEITSLKKIREVKKWGSAKWINMTAAFRDCSNLQITATDVPDLSNVTSLKEMFSGCTNLTGGNMGDWDVSNIITMEKMFANAENFNADISDWNVSNVDDMFNMFFQARKFNQDLSGWCMTRILTEPQGFHAGTTDWYKVDREPYWGRCAVWVGPNSSSNDLFSNTSNWLAGQIPDSLTLIIQISPKAEKNMRLERNLTPIGNNINYHLDNINFRNKDIKVILGDFNLQLNNFSGEKFWKFKTNGNGMVSIKVRSSQTIRFDVGDSSYNPVTIKNKDSTDFFQVNVYDFLLSNGLTGSQINGVPYVNRTWKILKADSSVLDGVDFVFEWNIEEEIDGLDNGGFENTYLNTMDANMNNWELAKTGSGLYNTGAQFLNHNAYKSYFYLFAIGATSAPLPYWYDFIVTKITKPENSVLLEWNLIDEINATSFEVLRKTNSDWEVINTINLIDYNFGSFQDNDPKSYNIYKLKVTDIYGEIHYTSTRHVLFNKLQKNSLKDSDIIISPNPNNGNFTIKLPQGFNAEYSIYDSIKKQVKTGSVSSSFDIHELSPSGFYYLVLSIDGKYITKKISVHP
jgi:surface protein